MKKGAEGYLICSLQVIWRREELLHHRKCLLLTFLHLNSRKHPCNEYFHMEKSTSCLKVQRDTVPQEAGWHLLLSGRTGTKGAAFSQLPLS